MAAAARLAQLAPAVRVRASWIAWAGGLLALAVAVALFTRLSLDDGLSRDEAIYAYGGQQWAHGLPPYASIFDPKAPMGTALAADGALAAEALGGDSLTAIRIVYLVLACLAVAAVYALGLRLWSSVPAALVGAIVFASFRGFAIDALAGPDAKTPGVLFGVLSMLLLASRRWFRGALVGSLAFLVWQPLVVYPVVAVVAALCMSQAGERRRHAVRALAGATVPVAVTALYFWLAGALGKLVEATITFPLTGLERTSETVGQRIALIARTVDDGYRASGVLLWAGLVAVLAVLAVHAWSARSSPRRLLGDPFVVVVVPTLAGIVAFSLRDFQGYPDLYPVLPYAAIGLGGAVAAVQSRMTSATLGRLAGGAALAGVAALAALSMHWLARDPSHTRELPAQRAQAAELVAAAGPRGTIYALGDPTPLVLSGRRNPSRFIYLESGVSRWVVEHTPGGFAGWTAQIRAARPAAIVLHGWRGGEAPHMLQWLRASYRPARLGTWKVFYPR